MLSLHPFLVKLLTKFYKNVFHYPTLVARKPTQTLILRMVIRIILSGPGNTENSRTHKVVCKTTRKKYFPN